MGRVAIVGRPNVGKSHLFNRLVGKREAIVADKPGVTRDVKESWVTVTDNDNDLSLSGFSLLDTGGLWSADKWESAIKKRVEYALRDTDVVLLCFDGRERLTSADYEIAAWLRSLNKIALLVATKLDHPKHENNPDLYESYGLGFGNIYYTSAEQGRGIAELLAKIIESLPTENIAVGAEAEAVRVAIIGRPNAGKSSLLNALIHDERVIVADVAGTTRDSIDVDFDFGGRPFVLVDTAGIRRKATEDIEYYSKLRAELAIVRADVNILVIDPFEVGDHEFRIANLALASGKPVVVAVNKWDLVIDEQLAETTANLQQILYHLRFVPWVFISAINDYGLHELLATAIRVYDTSRKRVTTGELNRWLELWTQYQPPPNFKGKPLKLFYATQADISPPTFIISVNNQKFITRAYEQYLVNRIREDLGFSEVPTQLIFKDRSGGKRVRLGAAANFKIRG